MVITADTITIIRPMVSQLLVLVPAVAGAALLLSPLTADPAEGARGVVPDRAGRVAVPVSLWQPP